MRNAVIIGTKPDGSMKLLVDPATSIDKQKELFKEIQLAGGVVDKEFFCEIRLYSDFAKRARFEDPKVVAARVKAAEAAAKAKAEAAAKAAPKK